MENLTYNDFIKEHEDEEIDLATFVTDYHLNLSPEDARKISRQGYNCMGFALNTFQWETICNYQETYNDDYDDPIEERNIVCQDCVSEILSLSDQLWFPQIREVETESDLQNGEYLVAFRTSEDDFHFMRRMSDGRWFEKCGNTILRECTDKVFDDDWKSISGDITYDSDIHLFAVKEVAA